MSDTVQVEGTPARKPLGEALDGAKFGSLHRKFWLLAALGIMLDGFDFFIIGVANPLIAKDFGASAAQTGIVSAAAIQIEGPQGFNIPCQLLLRVLVSLAVPGKPPGSRELDLIA
jgi:hypothetical protein